MKIIESIDEMQEYSQQLKREGKTIVSVDTDAYLHDGHKALVKIAKENADVLVLNAGHSADYKTNLEKGTLEVYDEAEFNYRNDTFAKDVELAKSYGVDVFFYPSMKELYVDELSIPIEIIEKVFAPMKNRDAFEAANSSMLNHIVSSYFPIFNVVTPDISVVGQKDAYQSFGIKSLIKQLDLPIEVIMAPIIRDSDGLACSSRNDFLTRSERERAVSIYKTLHEVSTWSKYAIDVKSVEYVKEYITSHIQSKWCNVDICCAETFEELDNLDRDAIIMVVAGPFGRKGVSLHHLVNDGLKTFLTDNIFVYQ